MRVRQGITIFSLLASVALPRGYATIMIPVDLDDGAYILTLDGDGTQMINHTQFNSKHRRLVNSAKFPRTNNAYRPVDGNWFPEATFGCDHHDNMDHDGFIKARSQLLAWCEHYSIPPRSTAVFLSGHAAVYACNYNHKKANGCFTNEYDWYGAAMDQHCGSYNGAHANIPGWKKTYGRTTPGASVCSNVAPIWIN